MEAYLWMQMKRITPGSINNERKNARLFVRFIPIWQPANNYLSILKLDIEALIYSLGSFLNRYPTAGTKNAVPDSLCLGS
jgi:hypothetical protein